MSYHAPVGAGGTTMDKVLLFLSLPTVTMMLGSILVFRMTLSARVIAALQHFASGILIGAAGWELVPEIEEATTAETIALIIGFILGAAFLLFVGRYDFKHWQKLIQRSPISRDEELGILADERQHYHSVNNSDDVSLKRDNTPYGLIFAVLVDGSIDGLLIGISCLSSEGAGLITSIALALEMGLLGISTASTLRKSALSRLTVIIMTLTMPLSIFFSGLLGLYLLAGLSGPYYMASGLWGRWTFILSN
jgi:zinc transporter ZupT